MNHFKTWIGLLAGAGVGALHAQVAQTNTFTGINLAIPAGNPAGVTDSRTITSGIAHITSLRVRLQITGDFNGDLYCYLQHQSGLTNGLTVLLNRTGRTAHNPYGYSDCGFNVAFSDSANTNDIHNYQWVTTPPKGLPLTGTWQPDARYIDPTQVEDTSLRTTFLREFNGLSAQGVWVLFVAGMEYGSTNVLNSWALEITGQPPAVPSVTWTNPAPITYGAALSAAQLNATANVPGKFSYIPPAGTVLKAGSGQGLYLLFVPADTNNYITTAGAVLLNVLPQPLAVTPNNLSRLYGTTNPLLTGSIAGVTNGDNITALYTTAASASSPVGSYAIVPLLQDPNGALVNYSVTTNSGTLVVAPAPLTVAAQNQSRTYGAANPLLSWSVTGFVNGDTRDSVLTGSPILSTLGTPASPVGAYPITPAQGTLAAANYMFDFVNGLLSVTPAALIGQANNTSRYYGQTNPVFTATYSVFVNGDDASVLIGPLSGSCPAQTNSPVGSYPISVSGQSALNYSIQYLPGTLAVGPTPLLVQANDASRGYGQTNPVFTASLLGLVNDENVSALEGTLVFATTAQTNSPVGSYPIVPSGLGSTNYSLAYSNGTLSVRPYALVATADNQSRSYGAPNPQLTGTLAGLQNGDNITATYSTTAGANSPVGSYVIALAFSDPNNLLPDYSVTTNTGTLTITPAPLVVSADNQSRSYGAPNPQLTGTLAGLQNGDNITPSFWTPAQTNSPAGNYPIDIGLSDPDHLLGNYSVSTNTGALTVSQAALIVQASNASRYYGQTNPVFTATYSGFANGDNASVLSGPLSGTCPAQTNSPVGSYPISVSGQSALNYGLQYLPGTLAVMAAPLVVQANNASRVVGQTNPVFSASFIGLGYSPNPAALEGALLFTTTAETNSPVGSYPIVPSGLSSTNYNLSFSNGTLRICEYALVVSPDNQSRSYGATNPPLTGTLAGLTNGDNITAAYWTDAGTNSPVGTYDIGVAFNDPDGVLSNYSVTTNTATLAITPAALVASPDNQSRSYGAPNPQLTGTLAGLQNGDDITATYLTAADANSPAGTYLIGVGFSDPDGLLSNYNVTTNTGTLTITPVPLVVSAENQSRSYGAPNPQLTGTVAGLQNGDNITGIFSTLADAASPVGTYAITAGLSDPGGRLSNYIVSTNDGTLTVAPAPLVVSPANQSSSYGLANLTLTGTVTGLQNGDNITANYWTKAGKGSPVGNYPILASLSVPGNLLVNYSVTTNTAVLTITPAVLYGQANTTSRPYGQTNPVFTLSYSGFLDADNASIVTGPLSWSCPAQTNSPAGVYPILAAGQSAPNYTIQYLPGNLTVAPAPLLVQANDASRGYGQTNPVFTATFAGFVNDDNATLLEGTLVFTTPAQTNSPLGDYPIVPSGLSSTNYTLTYSNGTLSVRAYELVVSPDDQSRSYGAPNPPLTGTVTGLQNGDSITAAYSTDAATNSPVGSYLIVAALGDPNNVLTNYSVTTNTGTLTVTPAALVVTADSQSRPYGAPNPPLTGTVAGLQNGDNITATYWTIAPTNAPAGAYTIGATLDDPDFLLPNYSVTINRGTLTITPAALVVDADNQSRTYGTTNPPLTGAITGLQNGDDITPSFWTPAQTNSPPGNYPINIGLSDPDNLLPNYSVLTNYGTLSIAVAPTVATVVSSANPAFLSSPVVTFTATFLFGAAGQAPAPAGSVVQFILDGVPCGPPAALVAGQASITSGALSLGSHSLSVQYQGNTDFLAATAVLNPPQIIRTFPVATNYVIARLPGQGTRVAVADLVAASSDGMGGTLTLENFSAASAQGGTVRLADNWLFYEPAAGFEGTDSFTYTMRDPYGVSAPGTVTIQVSNQASCLLTLLPSGAGTNLILVSGIPWKAYTIQYEESLANSNWQLLAAGPAGAQGTFQYYDVLPQGTPSRFYRAVWQSSTNPGAVDVSLTSSANPALPGASVTFTASVFADDPGSGFPSGAVQFEVDGQAAGPPVALAQGSAVLTTSSIPPGLHAISFDYGGDAVFLGGTGALASAQLINTPPIAGPVLLYRPPTSGTKAPLSAFLANDSDPDGNPISLDSVSPTTAEGGTASLIGGWVYYTPPTNFAGPDSFNYTIQDSFAATTVGAVTVEPLLSYGPAQSAAFVDVSNGTYSITFDGIPWNIYTIQYSEDPTSGAWQDLGTATANSWGTIQYYDTPPPGASPRYYQAVAQSQITLDSPFRIAVWTNFIANTNGRTMQMWSEYSLPDGWPNVPPLMAWDTNCLLFGLDGFTAISQCNQFQGSPGQVPATLLTPRHAYTRGHGMGPVGLTTSLAGQSVWFCTASNTLVQMTVAASIIRLGTVGGQSYDYGIHVFSRDAPNSITPMSVLSDADYEVYYPDTPDLPFLFFGTTQDGYCSAQVPPFVYPLLIAGDSGSPNMIPTPDNKLAMFSGRSTSGPSAQMQADMDTLTALVGLSTNNYQLRYYDMRPWGP
ncbi:MAG: MBG domain-containing protein [Limisphaerales bacterium]